MTDRPILFSAPMVRALLDGTKTQTRRVLKPQPNIFEIDERGTPCQVGIFHDSGAAYNRLILGRYITLQKVPFCIGDRLWVKETWACAGIYTDVAEIRYRASENASHTEFVEQVPVGKIANIHKWQPTWPKYKSPLFMQRSLSRLTLTVTDVRVERLQDISEADAVAEGVLNGPGADGPLAEYEALWDHINGPDAWVANPWVVAVSFTVGRHNIDQVPA